MQRSMHRREVCGVCCTVPVSVATKEKPILLESKHMELERFIASVRNRRSIWDQRQSDHHNRYVLDRLWKEVCEENKCTVKDAQSKWKSLRDYYRKEFRKIHHRPADGSGSNYISNWPCFKLMDFLREQFTPPQASGVLKRKRAPNDSETNEESTGEAAEKLDCWDPSSQNNSMQELSTTSTVDHMQSPQVNAEVSGSYTFSSMANEIANAENSTTADDCTRPNAIQYAKKSKNIYLQSLIDIESRKVSILEEKMAKNKQHSDEDQSFFASILPHVRNIKGVNKIHFRNEIQNLIIKYAYSNSATPSCATTSSANTYSAAMHPHAF